MANHDVHTPRDLTEDTEFGKAIEKLFGSHQKADAFRRSFDLALARYTTTYGRYVKTIDPGRRLYAFKTYGTPAWRSCLIVYSFDAERVYLHDISFAEASVEGTSGASRPPKGRRGR